MPKEGNLLAKKVEDWGKAKFKPSLKASTTRTSQNPFTKPQNFSSTGDNDAGHFNNAGFNGRSSRGGKFSGSNNKGRGGRFNGRGGGKFHGNNNRNFGQNNRGAGKYQKDSNDRVRFNPIARDAKPDIATPWTKFKDEINHKQREENQAASQANMDTDEAKIILKQREMNYRRLLMEQKKQETIHWEDFGENEQAEAGNRKAKKSKQQPIAIEQSNTTLGNTDRNKKDKKTIKAKNNNKSKNSIAVNEQELAAEHAGYQEQIRGKEVHSEKQECEENSSINTKNKNKTSKQFKSHKQLQLNTIATEMLNDNDTVEVKTKKKHTQMENKAEPETAEGGSNRKKPKKIHSLQKKIEAVSNETGENSHKESKESKLFLSKEELKNFNANTMSFQKKDALRRIITKGVLFQKGTNLVQCLKNRKYQTVCKEKKNKTKI